MLEAVLMGPWPAELRMNAVPCSDVERAIRSFGNDDAHASLAVDLEGARLACHFFCASEIEFDLDPSEIGEANFGALCAFMSLVSSATGRDVVVTEEKLPGDPDLRVLGGDTPA